MSETSPKDSNLQAFADLVQEHQAAIRAFVTARIQDPFEAQDLAQEVFLVAYRKLDELDLDRPVRGWLCTIAGNLVRNHRRKYRAVPVGGSDEEILDLLDGGIEDLEESWRSTPVFEALEQCREKLGEGAQDLLRLRYEEGQEMSEIRETLGAKHSALTMKFHRIRMKLKECIELRMEALSHG